MDVNQETAPSSDAMVGPGLGTKIYFRIGDVAEIVGVKPHVLRYWETEFPMVHPAKSGAGQRVYRRPDVEALLLVKHLLYKERYSIEGARRRIRELKRDGGFREQCEELGVGVAQSHGTTSVPDPSGSVDAIADVDPANGLSAQMAGTPPLGAQNEVLDARTGAGASPGTAETDRAGRVSAATQLWHSTQLASAASWVGKDSEPLAQELLRELRQLAAVPISRLFS